MNLVIAEKPSVAQSLSAVIGATARKDGYLEGNGWRVSWCVGHLAGLADADSYDPKYAKWRYDDLPILPEHWQMVVGKDKKKPCRIDPYQPVGLGTAESSFPKSIIIYTWTQVCKALPYGGVLH